MTDWIVDDAAGIKAAMLRLERERRDPATLAVGDYVLTVGGVRTGSFAASEVLLVEEPEPVSVGSDIQHVADYIQNAVKNVLSPENNTPEARWLQMAAMTEQYLASLRGNPDIEVESVESGPDGTLTVHLISRTWWGVYALSAMGVEQEEKYD